MGKFNASAATTEIKMTLEELHQSKHYHFKIGYQNCIEDIIRVFVNDLSSQNDDIKESFINYLEEIVKELKEEY